MKILLYTISKPASKSAPLLPLEEHYQKLCRSFGAEIVCKNIFSNHIATAQKQNPKSAQESYTKALLPLLVGAGANGVSGGSSRGAGGSGANGASGVSNASSRASIDSGAFIMSNIALHPAGKRIDSEGFAKLLAESFAHRAQLAFFVGGAFGFEEAFLRHTTPISLSPMTFSHTIIGAMLLEQIYRALSILANHPYHK
ncbi:hypothetical protein BKN38_03895 [Helicobacter sp. CLO-3]|uniref:23S rRNA (pseudouridine(1915)-N(3))-methyltransferase RlmH n=1 Tax=unclassified Helicobacter TaxID=2593540 RepID=UPI0008059DCD|nr:MULTISPECIES: 23S rRNA (pseudouridine(1915)-N(3))-methyltransferase RlmH [unclassified Helicobacter]OBV29857.1 hypothetical protein BA723_03955 [Helicobacter sp. CLO-3]OHU84063.1 hypothetical protein BKN38_03895 [Helicobacter sp. CLO-3]